MNFPEISTDSSDRLGHPALSLASGKEPGIHPRGAEDIAFETGLLLLSLQSFSNSRLHSFMDGNQARASSKHWNTEIRLSHSALLKISSCLSQLIFAKKSAAKSSAAESGLGMIDGLDAAASLDANSQFAIEDLNSLSQIIRNLAVLGEALLRTPSLGFHEWSAWSGLVSREASGQEIAKALMAESARKAENAIPMLLKEALARKPLAASAKADLQVILLQFGRLLSYLGVIGEMLKNDRPLKPALLFFTLIYEQSQETMSYINNRLLKFSDQENALFDAFDCSVFATSMEIRRVFNQELGDVASIKQAPRLRARVEAAFGLLSDSFQQSIHSFAKLLDPEMDIFHLFPNFQTKLGQSIKLRKDLWEILQATQAAEKNPASYPLPELHQKLASFAENSLQYLMYKDWETVERFIEEAIRTKNQSDLVAILHRFGAYLETLFGQVNMRIVLANHPFDPEEAEKG